MKNVLRETGSWDDVSCIFVSEKCLLGEQLFLCCETSTNTKMSFGVTTATTTTTFWQTWPPCPITPRDQIPRKGYPHHLDPGLLDYTFTCFPDLFVRVYVFSLSVFVGVLFHFVVCS